MRLITLLLLIISCAQAAQEIYPFKDKAQRQTFNHLTTKLRCMVCQNQNLADSNAELAIVMRNKIYQMVLAGQSEAEIQSYMQARYGDFIIYKPPLNTSTTVLWLLPFLILLSGGMFAWRQWRINS